MPAGTEQTQLAVVPGSFLPPSVPCPGHRACTNPVWLTLVISKPPQPSPCWTWPSSRKFFTEKYHKSKLIKTEKPRASPGLVIFLHHSECWGDFPGGSVAKDPPANARDTGSIPGLGRSAGVGSDNPLQYSCLGNPEDRGAWWATVHGVARSRTRLKQLSVCARYTAGLQCCVHFCWTAKWFSYTYILFYILFHCFIPRYWIEFPVLNGRILLFYYPFTLE